MATRTKKPDTEADKTVALPPEPPPELAVLDPEQAALDAAMRENESLGLASLIGQLSGAPGCSVTVYRSEKNQPQKYLFQCAPENFSLDDLRDRYGGGEFRLYIMRDNQLWKNRRVVVERLPAPDLVPIPALPGPGGGGGAGASPELAAIAEALRQQGQVLQALLNRPAPVAPTFDPAAMLGSMVEAFKTLSDASRPPPAPPLPAPIDNSSRSIDLVLKGVELARELGGGGGDTSVLDLARDFIRSPMLVEAVKSATQVKPLSSPAGSGIVNRASQVQTAVSTPPEPSIVPASGGAIGYLEALLAVVEQGGSPEQGADLVLDWTPPALLDQWIGRPDLLDYLVSLAPGLQKHRVWCEMVLTAVRAELTEGPESVKEGEINTPETDTGAPDPAGPVLLHP